MKSVAQVTKAFNMAHPTSRPISVSTCGRIRLGQPPMKVNPALRKHTVEESPVSIMDVVKKYDDFIHLTLPNLVERIEQDFEELITTAEFLQRLTPGTENNPLSVLKKAGLADKALRIAEILGD